ncbi:hypothetical protein DAPPUDRAFT_256618 [Daphnia pulex]|uniref:Uncharacterized protein n=1 Tax=Daphnia pulex TaxID=6669 RepID=E9HBS5_DAPPU|nr:hypothetical protein DAPPUDRAFT_256618 [Daphnia pulex]|eukprot:EFX70768.1 hypothetical protein DAPPUDRAFT_256618 [Daphnia pulex]
MAKAFGALIVIKVIHDLAASELKDAVYDMNITYAVFLALENQKLSTVHERCDSSKVRSPLRKKSPFQQVIFANTTTYISVVSAQASTQGLETQSDTASPPYDTYQATPSREKAKSTRLRTLLPGKLCVQSLVLNRHPKTGQTRTRTRS